LILKIIFACIFGFIIKKDSDNNINKRVFPPVFLYDGHTVGWYKAENYNENTGVWADASKSKDFKLKEAILRDIIDDPNHQYEAVEYLMKEHKIK
jgi:hypothetical protein